MKRYLSILLFVMVGLSMNAQSLTILDPLTLVEHSSVMVQYQNQFGSWNMPERDDPFPFAMIRMKLEGNKSQVTEAKKQLYLYLGTQKMTTDQYRNAPNEIWFLVETSIRNIFITCGDGCRQQLLYSGSALESNRVYTCRVEYVPESKPQQIQSQYLLFHVSPPEAMVEVMHDDIEETWTVNNGVARRFVKFGTYQYRVQADGYTTQTGTVVVNNADSTEQVYVTLSPNYGFLTIDAANDLEGAAVYVDNTLEGNVPLQSVRLSGGEHKLKVVKSLYKTYNATFTITGGETSILTPELETNFVELTMDVERNAEIWVNGELYGTGLWSGRLEPAEYLVETKLKGYRTMSQVISVTPSMHLQTIHLQQPSAVYGAIQVETLPDGASISLDGKPVGVTPKLLQDILIGEHTVRVSQPGFADYKATIVVHEGEIAKVEGQQKPSTKKQPSKSINDTLQLSLTPSYSTPYWKGGRSMNTFLMGEFGYALAPQMSYGVMFGQTYKGLGWYIKGRSNFRFTDSGQVSDAEGKVNAELPYYTGNTSSSELVVNVGFVGDILAWTHASNHRFSTFGFYIGGGYGYRKQYWETMDGQWVEYSPNSYAGLAANVGLMGSICGFTLNAGVNTVQFKYLEFEVGIGWMF